MVSSVVQMANRKSSSTASEKYPNGTSAPSGVRQANTSSEPLASSIVPPSQAGDSHVMQKIEYGTRLCERQSGPVSPEIGIPTSNEAASIGVS